MSEPTFPAVLCESAAAYVLGALPADERREFEAHLDACERCSRTVRELAGIPGLLARVSPADLVDTAPLPDTLLPRVLAGVRRRRRRRFRRARRRGRGRRRGGRRRRGAHRWPARRPADVRGGRRGAADRDRRAHRRARRHPGRPALQVRRHHVRRPAAVRARGDRSGRHHPAGSRPGGWVRTASRVVGSVDLAPAEIASVEVRTDTGTPVLRLRL